MASPRRDRGDRELPDKPYFKIGEVAEICGVKPSALRYWETCFPRLRPEKTRANQRIYKRRQVVLALEITDLLHQRGFTIDGARRALGQREPRRAPAEIWDRLEAEVRDLLRLCDE
jgi:DNA-binding transcriptional MerR regulator